MCTVSRASMAVIGANRILKIPVQSWSLIGARSVACWNAREFKIDC
mgnify:CR=1 FL=1